MLVVSHQLHICSDEIPKALVPICEPDGICHTGVGPDVSQTAFENGGGGKQAESVGAVGSTVELPAVLPATAFVMVAACVVVRPSALQTMSIDHSCVPYFIPARTAAVLVDAVTLVGKWMTATRRYVRCL